MHSSINDERSRAVRVSFTDDQVVVDLDDGRQVRTPLDLYPTLRDAARPQRQAYKLLGGGVSIYWESLDLLFAAEHLVMGVPERVFPKPTGRAWQDPANFVIPADEPATASEAACGATASSASTRRAEGLTTTQEKRPTRP